MNDAKVPFSVYENLRDLFCAAQQVDTLLMHEAYEKFCREVESGLHADLITDFGFIRQPEKTLAVLQAYGLCFPGTDTIAAFNLRDLQLMLQSDAVEVLYARVKYHENNSF